MFKIIFVFCVVTFQPSFQISFRSKVDIEDDWRADLMNQLVEITDILSFDEYNLDVDSIEGGNQVNLNF